MIKEAIGTGKTVDIAIENACAQIGLPREEVSIEVMSLPRKAFLGMFGGTVAKVRVTVEIADEPKPKVTQAPRQQAPSKPAQSQPKPPAPAPRPQAPKPAFNPASSTANKTQPISEAPKQPIKPKPVVNIQEEEVVGIPVEEGSKGAMARDFLSDVIKAMGIENCKVTATQEDKTIVLKLEGDATGVIIGKRGETLDALQYLSALASNRVEGDYARVVIDSGNYRQRRQQTLEQLAAKLAASVLRSGRNATLEPMNPYERRIIHAAVSEIEGVKSISVGEDPKRSVVITTTDGVVSQARSNNNRRPQGRRPDGQGVKQSQERTEGADKNPRPRYNKPKPNRPNGNTGSDSRPSRPPRSDRPQDSQPVQPKKEGAVRTAPTEAANQPLYGKIEIK